MSTARWIGVTAAVAVTTLIILIGTVLYPHHRPDVGRSPAPGGSAAGASAPHSTIAALLGFDEDTVTARDAAAATARSTRASGGTAGLPSSTRGGVGATATGAGTGSGGSAAGGGGSAQPAPAAPCQPGVVAQLLNLLVGGQRC